MSSRLFRIATFNVNSVRVRLPILIDWLKTREPDVICLQETKVQDHEFPVEAFSDAGYHAVYNGAKSYSGVAIISREEPLEVHYGFDDEGPADGERLIRARVRGIDVLNTYVPQGRDPESPHFQYKLKWFDRLKTLLAESFSPEGMVLWCGDLNVAPEPMDVYDSKRLWGHVCHCAEATEALCDVMKWGLVDVFRKHHPEPEQFTFFDYRVRNAVARKVGWRVDHILATPSLAERSVDSFIDTEPRKKERPSDHTCLAADFELP